MVLLVRGIWWNVKKRIKVDIDIENLKQDILYVYSEVCVFILATDFRKRIRRHLRAIKGKEKY